MIHWYYFRCHCPQRVIIKVGRKDYFRSGPQQMLGWSILFGLDNVWKKPVKLEYVYLGAPALHFASHLHLITYHLLYLALLPASSISVCDSCFISVFVPFIVPSVQVMPTRFYTESLPRLFCVHLKYLSIGGDNHKVTLTLEYRGRDHQNQLFLFFFNWTNLLFLN